jgi:hypothetical protein
VENQTEREFYDGEFLQNIRNEALYQALETRKFEIEMYWKRATYFWGFLIVIFAGYFTVLNAKNITDFKEFYLLLIAALGCIFSISWFYVNKGSKYWQENWENHVDYLEDNKIGPLFKVIIKEKSVPFHKKLTNGGRYSVSKINQLLSFFLMITWFIIGGVNILQISMKNGWIMDYRNNIEFIEVIGIIIFFLLIIIFISLIKTVGRSSVNKSEDSGWEKRDLQPNNKKNKKAFVLYILFVWIIAFFITLAILVNLLGAISISIIFTMIFVAIDRLWIGDYKKEIDINKEIKEFEVKSYVSYPQRLLFVFGLVFLLYGIYYLYKNNNEIGNSLTIFSVGITLLVLVSSVVEKKVSDHNLRVKFQEVKELMEKL